jgi:hypothetical protein
MAQCMARSSDASGPRYTLPLEDELRSGAIRTALLCHAQDRWYVGELFCHAAWLEVLQAAGIRCEVCTNLHYLEIFEGHPAVSGLSSAALIEDRLSAGHDLVIIATTHPPDCYDARLARAIYVWNDGMAFVRHGQMRWEHQTDEFNLFLATRHRHGQTALPDGRYFRMALTAEERGDASRRFARVLGHEAEQVTIFNPTASNPHTRNSARPKAVDNTLEVQDCTRLLELLLAAFPEKRVVIGAPLKPGDHRNHHNMAMIAGCFAGHPRVGSLMTEVSLDEGLSFRAFGAVLLDRRVVQMIGNSTGSNAHLAAALDVAAVSIERRCDDVIRANWESRARGQMGSFRWRNSEPSTAAYCLPWDDRSARELSRAVGLLRWHSLAFRGDWSAWFGDRIGEAGLLAQDIGAGIPGHAGSLTQWFAQMRGFARLLRSDELRSLYFDFCDEAAYFEAVGEPAAAALMRGLTALGEACGQPVVPNLRLEPREQRLVQRMTATANLFKVLAQLAARRGAAVQSSRRDELCDP